MNFKKYTDKISGITIIYGDESHPNNLEIEVDHEIKRRIDTLEENQKQMMANLSKILKESEKEDRKFKSKLIRGLFTKKEIDHAKKKAKDWFKDFKYIGNNNYRVDKDFFETILFAFEEACIINKLAKDSKIIRIK